MYEPRWIPSSNALLVCTGGALVALDAATGADMWAYRAAHARAPAPRGHPRLHAAVVTEESNSRMHAVNAHDGTRMWDGAAGRAVDL